MGCFTVAFNELTCFVPNIVTSLSLWSHHSSHTVNSREIHGVSRMGTSTLELSYQNISEESQRRQGKMLCTELLCFALLKLTRVTMHSVASEQQIGTDTDCTANLKDLHSSALLPGWPQRGFPASRPPHISTLAASREA